MSIKMKLCPLTPVLSAHPSLLFVKVAQKRWKLEINYSQNATLMLSSMNMPDGIQVFDN